jgi:hypothetical protein
MSPSGLASLSPNADRYLAARWYSSINLASASRKRAFRSWVAQESKYNGNKGVLAATAESCILQILLAHHRELVSTERRWGSNSAAAMKGCRTSGRGSSERAARLSLPARPTPAGREIGDAQQGENIAVVGPDASLAPWLERERAMARVSEGGPVLGKQLAAARAWGTSGPRAFAPNSSDEAPLKSPLVPYPPSGLQAVASGIYYPAQCRFRKTDVEDEVSDCPSEFITFGTKYRYRRSTSDIERE